MIDFYENLTLKSVGPIKWMDTYCSNFNNVIKAVVNILHFADVLRKQISPEDEVTPRVLCAFNNKAIIRRDLSSKWHVPITILLNLQHYPPFC